MKIGFIGAGQIGGNWARLAVNAGHDVLISNSRNPRTLFTLLPPSNVWNGRLAHYGVAL